MRFKIVFVSLFQILSLFLFFKSTFETNPLLKFFHTNNFDNSSTIYLQKNPPSLQSSTLFKFSIKGATIVTVDLFANDSLWRYELSDKTTLELYIIPLEAYTVQYYLIWYGGGSNEGREICIHYGDPKTFWYPTYSSLKAEWPLDPQRNVARFPFSYLNDDATVHYEYSDVVEQLFVNTDGVGLLPAPGQPLFMRREANIESDSLMCFSVEYTWPYNRPPEGVTLSSLDIKIHLFQASTIRDVVDLAVTKSGLISKPTSLPDENMFQHPSWVSWNQPEEVLKYPQVLRSHGFTGGEILIDEHLLPGLNPTADFDRLVEEIHAQGFQVKLAKLPTVVRPISDHSPTNNYFTRIAATGERTDWVDFSHEIAREWYRLLLRRLQLDNGVDSFALMGTQEPEAVLVNVTTSPFLQSSDRTVAHFELLAPLSTGSSAHQAFRTQHLPLFVQLTASPASAEDYLQSVLIPSALAISIGGYSWFSPKPIGLPNPGSDELYIRWVQAVALLPHFTFYTHPWQYSDHVNSVILKYVRLHESYATFFKTLAEERIRTGAPIIRPLWYNEPFNANVFSIKDQFMVGNKLVVAPVLKIGQRTRTVFLPNGIWFDVKGNRYIGAGHFTVSAEVDELPYFIRGL